MGGEDIAVDNEINFLKQGFEVETLFFENNVTNVFSEIKSFILNKNTKSINKLKNKMNEFQPDIVYVHNTWFKASVGILNFRKQNIQTLVKFIILDIFALKFSCKESL